MVRLMALALGAAVTLSIVTAAQGQNCTTRPDGLGGTRMTCDDGSSSVSRPDGLGGVRTTIQPGFQQPQPFGMPQQPPIQQPRNCVTRPNGLGGYQTSCY